MSILFTFSSPQLDLGRQTDFQLNNPTGFLGIELRRRGRRVLLAAKRQVGVDTGQLKTALKMVHRRRGAYQEISIGANVSHARDHHEGTRPHQIRATKQNMLRFSSGGRIVYRRNVMHPGTRPNRYLTDNIKLFYV